MLAEANTAAQSTRSEVLAALRQASIATGSDFDYLLGTAMRESSLKPSAKASGSSASGLFQFVSQTWLGMVKQYGAKYGLGSFANAIDQGADGRCHVASGADRQAILALRNDPKVAALMAGEYANQTKSQLESRLGRNVRGGELYAAHFLGPGAACRLIQMSDASPQENAAACFPAAAAANRSVFYNRDGSAKTVREVYEWAVKQPQAAADSVARSPSTGLVAQGQRPTKIQLSPAAFAALPAKPAADSWSALSLFAAAGPADGLIQAGSLPQAPFVLTPGVVSLLASLTPGGLKEGEDRGTV